MEASTLAALLGILLTPGSYAQGAVTGTTAGSSALQPWLVGLAAVLGFLGVVFVGSLINRCFFANKREDEDSVLEKRNIELRPAQNVYENTVLDMLDEEPSDKAKPEDQKLTTM